MDTAAAQREEMKQLQNKLGEEEKVSMARKGEVEVKLSKIQPVLDEAKTAVGSIKSENLYEIKSLKTPSQVFYSVFFSLSLCVITYGIAKQTISNVLEGVLMLMGIYDTSWNSMKTFLGQRNVKDQILNFDAHNITSGTTLQYLQSLMDFRNTRESGRSS
jgi:dynein heavy chain 2